MTDKEVNTNGGTVIDGNVNSSGGDFIGRDAIISKVNSIDGGIFVASVSIVAILIIALLVIIKYTPDEEISPKTVTLNFQPQIAKEYLLPVEDQAYLVAIVLSLRDLAEYYNGSAVTAVTSVDKGKVTSDKVDVGSSMVFGSNLIVAGSTRVRNFTVASDIAVLLYFTQNSENIIIVRDLEIQELPKNFSMTSLFKVLIDNKISFSNIESNDPGVFTLKAKYGDKEVSQTVLY